MPTYNSSDTIEQALLSIREQTFDQNQIEIIVVDGGSDDCTLMIAKKYGAKIINNPDRLPEYAKLIGMNAAKGKYMCILDSDEVIKNSDSFTKKFVFMENNSYVHVAFADLVAPISYNPICTYMNDAGDPFSCFIYRRWGTTKYNLQKKIHGKFEECYIYKFSKNDLLPVGDSNTIFDLDYIRKKYDKEMKEIEPAVLWDTILRDSFYMGYFEKDYVIHLSKCDLKTYLKKLKFRVINNIHDVRWSGYAARAKGDKILNNRKYLFPFYCVSIIGPIFDGLRMAILHKNIVFLYHPLFAWYVFGVIVIQYFKKLCGKKEINISYGK